METMIGRGSKRRSHEPREALRSSHRENARGVGVMLGALVGFGLTITAAFVLANGLGPEREVNGRLVAHEESPRPAAPVPNQGTPEAPAETKP